MEQNLFEEFQNKKNKLKEGVSKLSYSKKITKP